MTSPLSLLRSLAWLWSSSLLHWPSSLAFYKNEDARIKEITTAKNVLVGEQALRRTEIMQDNGKHHTPDGSIFVQCEKFARHEAASAFTEVKKQYWGGRIRSHPTGSVIMFFSILQKMYVALLSDFQRLMSCSVSAFEMHVVDSCPAFLIGIAGPFLIISGAVFADRFISQHLTEYYFLGGMPHLNNQMYEIARVLKTLKLFPKLFTGTYTLLLLHTLQLAAEINP